MEDTQQPSMPSMPPHEESHQPSMPAAMPPAPAPAAPAAPPAMPPTHDAASSKSGLYIALAVFAVLVIIGVLAWYFVFSPAPAAAPATGASALEQSQTPPLSSGNTMADIQSDLNHTPSDSAALNQDAAASNQAIQSL